jgi:hypothetical protein
MNTVLKTTIVAFLALAACHFFPQEVGAVIFTPLALLNVLSH